MGGKAVNSTVVSVRLPNEQFEVLKAEADLRGRKPSWAIKEAIEAWLARQGVSRTRAKP